MSDIQRILDHLRCARSSDECQCLDYLAADEIERLLGIIAARDEWACKAHERIEELEEQAENDFVVMDKMSGEWYQAHRITDAQIDAAWHGPNNLITREALKELGIERCGVCGGEKQSMEWGEGALQCSTCHGKGWIKT